jgi:hypothetical protein
MLTTLASLIEINYPLLRRYELLKSAAGFTSLIA